MSRWIRNFVGLLAVLLSCAPGFAVPPRDVSSVTLKANGYQVDVAMSGGTWTSPTVDPTKITIVAVSLGYDATGAATTTTRTFSVSATATGSGSNVTLSLDQPIFTKDNVGVGNSGTVPTIAMSADAITASGEQMNAYAAANIDVASTPSTVAMPLHSGIHFIDPPHQRYTGSTFDLRALGLNQYGWAACKMGITRCLEVTGTGGITGTFAYPEAITFAGVGPGATAVLAPGSDITGAGTKVLRVFLRSGTVTVGDTATGGTSGATIIVTSSAGGGETSGFATFTTRDRDGSYGPATKQDVWSYTVTPPAVDRYERWWIFYPTCGDTSWDSRSLSVRSANNVMTGDSCRGSLEIYCDPGNTLSASQKTYYVDSTFTATANTYSGTFGQFEWCKAVTAGGTFHSVVCAIGNNAAGTQSATSFRYNALPFGVVAYTMQPTGLAGGTPAYGDIMVKDESFNLTTSMTGIVLAWDGTTLTYLQCHGTNFATEAIRLRTAAGADRGVTFTAATVSTLATTAPASGDIITGYSSAATCTLTAGPTANGSDSYDGTVADFVSGTTGPLLTMQKAMKLAGTARGDSLCDGTTIYLNRGLHWQVYAAGNETESRDYWATITRSPGTELDNVRITRYNTASTNGNLTNFQKWYGVTFWVLSSQSGINNLTMQSGGNVTGNYDRPAYWFDGCSFISHFRWTRGLPFPWATSSAPFYSAITNSILTQCHCAAHLYRDVKFTGCGDDLTTTGRAVFNIDAIDIDATGTQLHSDIWQGQLTENGNLLIWGLRAYTLSTNVQQAPFIGGSTTASISSLGFVNMLQGDSLNSQVGMTGGTSVTGTFNSLTWIDCSYADDMQWRASTSSPARTAVINNLRVASTVWKSHTKTDTGTITGIFPGCYYNNHFITSPSNNGYGDTTGSSFASMFTSTTETDATWFVPKAASVGIDRDPYASRPNGWPRYDVFGRLRSQDAAGQASIGAAQPLPTLTVTYDGDSMSDGGTVTETAGSRELRFGNTTGVTGSVAYVSSVTLGGSVSGTDGSPYTLTAGGSVQEGVIATTLAAGAGTIDIAYDLSSVFDFDITGQSNAGFFRQRNGKRQRWPRRRAA